MVQLKLFSEKVVRLAVPRRPRQVPPTHHGARVPSRFSGRAPSVVHDGTGRGLPARPGVSVPAPRVGADAGPAVPGPWASLTRAFLGNPPPGGSACPWVAATRVTGWRPRVARPGEAWRPHPLPATCFWGLGHRSRHEARPPARVWLQTGLSAACYQQQCMSRCRHFKVRKEPSREAPGFLLRVRDQEPGDADTETHRPPCHTLPGTRGPGASEAKGPAP